MQKPKNTNEFLKLLMSDTTLKRKFGDYAKLMINDLIRLENGDNTLTKLDSENVLVEVLQLLEIAKYRLLNYDSIHYEPEIESIKDIQKSMVHFITINEYPNANL